MPHWNSEIRVNNVCNGDDAIMALRHFLLSFFLFFSLSVSVKASALTTSISANERICFFADVDKAGEKIGVRCWLMQRRPMLTFVDLVLLRRTLTRL